MPIGLDSRRSRETVVVSRLNLAQKVVLEVALGVVLAAGRTWILHGNGPSYGWFNYAPNSDLANPGHGWTTEGVFALTTALAIVWAIAGLILLRSPRASADSATASATASA